MASTRKKSHRIKKKTTKFNTEALAPKRLKPNPSPIPPSGAICINENFARICEEKFGFELIRGKESIVINDQEIKFEEEENTYIHTVQCLNSREETKQSTMAYGVFALRDIPRGTYVMRPYEGLNKAKAKEAYLKNKMQMDSSYLFLIRPEENPDSKREIFKDARFGGNSARFVNHSYSPNCEILIKDNNILFITKEKVTAGAQLTFDYGPSYDLEVDYQLRSIRDDDNHQTDEEQYEDLKETYKEFKSDVILRMLNVKMSEEEKKEIYTAENTQIFIPQKWYHRRNACAYIKHNGRMIKTGITRLMYLCFNISKENKKTVDILLRSNCTKLNYQSFNGFSALRYLMYGTTSEQFKVVYIKRLIKAGVLYDLKVEGFHTSLWDGIHLKSIDMIQAILEAAKQKETEQKKQNLDHKLIEGDEDELNLEGSDKRNNLKQKLIESASEEMINIFYDTEKQQLRFNLEDTTFDFKEALRRRLDQSSSTKTVIPEEPKEKTTVKPAPRAYKSKRSHLESLMELKSVIREEYVEEHVRLREKEKIANALREEEAKRAEAEISSRRGKKSGS